MVGALRRAAGRSRDHGRLQARAASLLPRRDGHPGPDGVVPGAGLRSCRGPLRGVRRHRGQHPRGQHRRRVRGGHHRRLQAGPASLLPQQSRVAGRDGHPAEARPRHTRRASLVHDRGGAPQRRHAAGGCPGPYVRSPTRQHGGLLGRRGGLSGAPERLGTQQRRGAEHRPGPHHWAAHVRGAQRRDRLLLGPGTRRAARAGQHRDPLSAGSGSRHRRRGGCGRGVGLHLRGPSRRRGLVLGTQLVRAVG